MAAVTTEPGISKPRFAISPRRYRFVVFRAIAGLPSFFGTVFLLFLCFEFLFHFLLPLSFIGGTCGNAGPKLLGYELRSICFQLLW
jgi:hypothetical protein